MISVNPYLNFPGNAEEAFAFYRSVFGGEFRALVRFKDMPMPGAKLRKEDEGKILHIALPVGKDGVLMASDALESHGMKVTKGNDVHLALVAETKEEADRLFRALSAGGKVQMPMADQPWGDYYGSFQDRFGIWWMVSYTYPKAN